MMEEKAEYLNLEGFTPITEQALQALKTMPEGSPPVRAFFVADSGDGRRLTGWGFLVWKGDRLCTMLDNARYTELDPIRRGRTWEAYLPMEGG